MEHLKKYRIPAFFLFGALCLVSFFWMAKVLFVGYYPDFVTQYVVPTLVFSGQNPYTGGEGLYTPQVYPPTTSLLFWPITLLPITVASYFYTLLSIGCLLVSLYLLFRLYDEKLFSVQSLVLMTLAFIYFPVKFTLGMGQVNHFILLLLVLSLWFLKKNKEFVAGMFLGLSIVIKLFPIFLPLYFFIKIKKIPYEFKDKFHWSGFFRVRIFNFRLWVWPSQISENVRLLLGLFFVILLSLMAIIILVPMELNLHFIFEVLPSLASSWKLDYYNQALSGFVGRSFGTEMTGTIIKFIVSGLITIVSLYAVSKNEKMDFLTVSLKFGTLIIVSLLVNTFSWQHHFVWLILPFFAVFYYLQKNQFGVNYFLILFISYFLTAINFRDPHHLPVVLQSHVFVGTFILLGLCIRLLFLKQEK